MKIIEEMIIPAVLMRLLLASIAIEFECLLPLWILVRKRYIVQVIG